MWYVSLELCDINRLPRRYAPRNDGDLALRLRSGTTWRRNNLFFKDNEVFNLECIG